MAVFLSLPGYREIVNPFCLSLNKPIPETHKAIGCIHELDIFACT